MHRIVPLALVLALTGCPSRRPPAHPTRPPPPPPPPAGATWQIQRVETAAAMPGAPEPGTYQIHMIDVGTGLSILIRGSDFAMLYDAGTNDRDEKPTRVVHYLEASLGPSGDDLCTPSDTQATERHAIDHVILSHPHADHASAMDLVVHCYDVKNFWDSGAINPTVFYRELTDELSRSTATTYHTAADVPSDHGRTVKELHATIPRWERFSEGDTVELGAGARFTILHADPKKQEDYNQNSVVVLVELGPARLLLVGDAESGPRKDPSYPAGDVEEFLIEQHAKQIRADILQVGHHGSKTSSRRSFLDAVHPRLALVSSGPKQYGHTVLPDIEVIEAIKAVGAQILRTDERDGECPVHDRIGGDHGSGGCDSYVITIRPSR